MTANQPRPEVVVMGGANIDVKSRSSAPLRAATSNPGQTTLAVGGVGRNIAESLARLGVPTALWSAVGDDVFGGHVVAHASRVGIDTAGLEIRPGEHTGVYNAILDDDGSLVAAVSSMEVLAAVTPEVVAKRLRVGPPPRWIVLDANLPTATIRAALALAADLATPVAIDPVSVAKAARLSEVLDTSLPVALLTPNLDELEALTGQRPDGPEATARACRSLYARGVERVWVRLGARGSVLCASDGTGQHIATIPLAAVADVTGAGDAALAGYIWAVLRNTSPARAARFGTAAALCTLRSTQSADDHLDVAQLERIEPTIPEAL